MNAAAHVSPIFAIILLGYLVARKNIITEEAVSGMMIYIQYIAVPMLLFRSFATTKIADSLTVELFIAYYLPAIIIFGIGFLLGKLLAKQHAADAAVSGSAAAFANTVLVGIPLVQSVGGNEIILFAVLAFHSSLLLALLFFVVQVLSESEPSLKRFVRRFFTPVIVAALCGVLWQQFIGELPLPLDRFTAIIASSTGGVALFALGCSLSRRQSTELVNWRGKALLMSLIGLKAVAFPALVWTLSVFVFKLSTGAVFVLTLIAALPTGISPWVIAERYARNSFFAASTATLSTLASAVVLSALLIFLL